LHSSVLERTESDLSKINWLRCIILLHSNSFSALGQVSIVSHSYQIYFSFPRSYLNLDCRLRDHVIMRFASVGIWARLRNNVICLCYFFFNVPLSFSVFASFIFLFFVSVSLSKKKKKVIFDLVTVSNHISNTHTHTHKIKQREIKWNLKDDSILLQKYNS